MSMMIRHGGGWATEEWIVFNDGTSTRLRYWKVTPASGFTALTDIAMPYSGNYGIATSGSFVFVGGAATPDCRQFAWNGSTLTQRHNGDPGALTTNQFGYEFYYAPGNAGYIMACGAGDFGEGVQTWSFQTAPTYSYGTPTSFDPGGGPSGFLDFRVGSVGQRGYGNTFVGLSGTGVTFYAMTVSGTAITNESSLSITNAGVGNKRGGCDRDTGLIALLGSSTSTIYMAQLNMSSRALSAIGNGTITGTTAYAVTVNKGFVVTYENTGKVRSYSRSGSTLTLVNTLDLGGTPTQGLLIVSPYTNLIYLLSDVSGSSRVISLSDSGTLASLVTLTNVVHPVGGFSMLPICFLSAALPTV